MIAIGDIQRVKNALAAIPELVEEDVEQLLRDATVSAHCGVSTVVYRTVEHFISDQVCKAVLWETIDRNVEKYFKARQADEALGKRHSVTTILLL